METIETLLSPRDQWIVEETWKLELTWPCLNVKDRYISFGMCYIIHLSMVTPMYATPTVCYLWSLENDISIMCPCIHSSRELYGNLKDVLVPDMYIEKTTRKVLTMQWIEVSFSFYFISFMHPLLLSSFHDIVSVSIM